MIIVQSETTRFCADLRCEYLCAIKRGVVTIEFDGLYAVNRRKAVVVVNCGGNNREGK